VGPVYKRGLGPLWGKLKETSNSDGTVVSHMGSAKDIR